MSLKGTQQSNTMSSDMYYYLSTALLGIGMILYPFIRGVVLFGVIDMDTVMIVVGLHHTIYALTKYQDAKKYESQQKIQIPKHQNIEVNDKLKDCPDQSDSECYAIHISNDSRSKQPLKVDVYELAPICKKEDKESVLELLPIHEQFEGITLDRAKH